MTDVDRGGQVGLLGSLDGAPENAATRDGGDLESLFWSPMAHIEPSNQSSVGKATISWTTHIYPLVKAVALELEAQDTISVGRAVIAALRRACTGKKAPANTSERYREAFKAIRSASNASDFPYILDRHAARLLQLSVTTNGRRGVTIRETSDHRRNAGTYITPTWLARAAVDVALSTWLRNHGFNRDHIETAGIPPFKGMPQSEQKRLKKLVKDLEIADFCCGTAVFLRVAAERIYEIRSVLESPNGIEARLKLYRDVVRRQIFGVEKDPVMIDAARSIFEEIKIEDRSLGVSPKIVHGDALTGAITEHQIAQESFADSVVWYKEFPNIIRKGGFGIIVSNVPWKKPKVMGREALRAIAPEIAGAVNSTVRNRLLGTKNERANEVLSFKRRVADLYKDRLRNSGLYKHSINGDFNLYGLFAERADHLLKEHGAACLVVPTGIATDKEISPLFQKFMSEKRLACVFDFENRKKIFPEVDGRLRFCLFGTSKDPVKHPLQVSFYLHSKDDLMDGRRSVPIRHEDIALIKPSTRTLPVCRSAEHLKLLSILHKRAIPLGRPRSEGGWGIRYKRHFDMTTDSHHFVTAEPWPRKEYVRLYEGRMVGMFDHRRASSGVASGNAFRSGRSESTSETDYKKKTFSVTSRYVVSRQESEVRLKNWNEPWLLGYKEISSATNSRTMIASILPRVAAGNKVPLILPEADARLSACLLANLNSVVYDFACRQHIGNITLNWHVIEQTPVLPPHNFATNMAGDEKLVDWIVERVWKLTATAQDLRGWSNALGHNGSLHRWDKEERLELQSELDAMFLTLYRLTQSQAWSIFSLFPKLIENGYAERVMKARGEIPNIRRIC